MGEKDDELADLRARREEAVQNRDEAQDWEAHYASEADYWESEIADLERLIDEAEEDDA